MLELAAILTTFVLVLLVNEGIRRRGLRRPDLPKPTLDVPVVDGGANYKCGPALLRAALLGYGKDVPLPELIVRLSTDNTGASIDEIEEQANALGLPALQQMIPADLLRCALASFLPAIVVRVSPAGITYFELLWRLETPTQVQVLSCDHGRLSLPVDDIVQGLYQHTMDVPEADIATWLPGAAFTELLATRLVADGVPEVAARAEIARLRTAEGWRGIARLDASARAAARLGVDPLALHERARQQGDAPTGLTDDDWSVLPSAVPDQVRLRGAVILQLGAR